MLNERAMGAVEFVGVMKGLIPKCDEFGQFNRGLAIVKKNGKYGVVNTEPRLLVPIECDKVTILDNHILTEKNHQYFLHTLTGVPLMHPIFMDAEMAVNYSNNH